MPYFLQIDFSKASFHDSVVLYFKAVNASLYRDTDQGESYKGIKFIRNIWGRDHVADEGIGVFDHVAINANGDREADYSLLDMTRLTDGEFEVVENYVGLTGEIKVLDSIQWPTGANGPPEGIAIIENTQSDSFFIPAIVIGITSVVAIFLLGVIAIYFFYRQFLLLWKSRRTAKNWERMHGV
ncbi:atrial natriuretic peptide receptor 3-like [Amphiura filiformis]|uniref:atrial natriuretic peptide receptor 3-like n=1 Tax=Amphiura filiformis TaxID=82378 RepID=UPI003B228D6D